MSHKGFAVHVITGLSQRVFLLVKIAPTVVWNLVTTNPLSFIIIINGIYFLGNLKEEHCTM